MCQDAFPFEVAYAIPRKPRAVDFLCQLCAGKLDRTDLGLSGPKLL